MMKFCAKSMRFQSKNEGLNLYTKTLKCSSGGHVKGPTLLLTLFTY